MKTFYKQPSELLDYDFNYSEWLVDDDILSDAVISIEDLSTGSKLTLKVKNIPFSELQAGDYDVIGPLPNVIITFFVVADEYVKVWVDGGDDREKYKITCTAETHNGRIKESEAILKIKEQ